MHIQKQIDRLITDQASQWLETLQTATPTEKETFVQWLRQSPRHLEEFLEVVAVERALGDLDLEHRIDVDALVAQIAPNVAALTRDRIAPSGRRPQWRFGLAAAAAVVTLAIALPMYFTYFKTSSDIITGAGEQRTVLLEDGSVMTVNESSHARIAYSKRERNIELRSGEAVFRVAREAARPFQVQTPTAIVRAVGTQFNVNQKPSGTVVSVLEGRVRILTQLQDQPGLAAPVEPGIQDLKAGEEAEVESTGHIHKQTAPDVARAVAWQRKSLKFEETPLDSIVTEINRYSAVKLRLQDEEIGSRRYGGIFDGTDPESLAAVLEREPDLVVERRGDEIVVRRR